MNQEIKKLWVEDLRRNTNLQGIGSLCQYDENKQAKYCCLGRLCELAIQNSVEVQVEEFDGLRRYDGHSAIPPKSVLLWANLMKFDLYVKVNDFKHYLPQFNDFDDHDFNEIADLIEAQL